MIAVLLTFASIFAYEFKPAPLKDLTYKAFHPPILKDVFIPPGFDDTDNVEVTFMNTLPNACYLYTQVSNIDINVALKRIRVSVEATISKADFCAARISSHPMTMSLGELPAGTYQLEFQTADREYSPAISFSVSHTEKQTRDEFEYAGITVNTLTVDVDQKRKAIDIKLPVVFPDGCYDFKEVEVKNGESVIEILPIVELKTNVCTHALVFKTHNISIPYTETNVRKLIHIRASNGYSVNRIVDL